FQGLEVDEVENSHSLCRPLGDRMCPTFELCQVSRGNAQMPRQPGLCPSQLSPYGPQLRSCHGVPSHTSSSRAFRDSLPTNLIHLVGGVWAVIMAPGREHTEWT